MPDHPRGYTKKGNGYQAPDEYRAGHYRTRARHPAFELSSEVQRFLCESAIEICERRKWKLYASGAEVTHIHFLVGWHDYAPWNLVRGKLKNLLSLSLSRRAGVTGRPWFSAEASRKRVRNPAHMSYLRETYLPNHSGWRFDVETGMMAPRRRARRAAPSGAG
jgi:hypothetical protein